jgi:hypothetical protein
LKVEGNEFVWATMKGNASLADLAISSMRSCTAVGLMGREDRHLTNEDGWSRVGDSIGAESGREAVIGEQATGVFGVVITA